MEGGRKQTWRQGWGWSRCVPKIRAGGAVTEGVCTSLASASRVPYICLGRRYRASVA